jgi:FkbM family methyltransferase
MGMRTLSRVVGALSRRLERPELLAAVDFSARQGQREAIGISAVLASTLRGDGVFVDVGANRGQLLREAIRVAPRARHVAFEPVPTLAVELARAFPTVDCRQLALGAWPGVSQFCYFRALDGWSGLRRSPHVSDAQGDPQYITVNVSTLDQELGELDPTVVKIDVEGAELAVLEGGRELISRSRPLVIFEHVSDASALYGASSDDSWELLSGFGYEIYSALGEGPFSRAAFADANRIVNWLAVPPSRNGESQ